VHPPASVCKELYQIRPDLRLAWVDHPWRENEDDPDELVQYGTFGIIQLVPKAIVGSPEDPKTFMPPLWEHVHGQGDIFSRRGDTRPDWNSCSLQPVLMAETVPHFDYHPRDVFTGRFIGRLRLAMKTKQEYKAHQREVALKKGRALEDRQNAATYDAAAYWKWVANRDTSAGGYQGTKQDMMARVPQHFRDAMDGALDYNDFYLDAWCLR
jgi:hypothetical protein